MSSINRDFFFNRVRLTLFDGKLTQAQSGGLTALLDYWEANHASADDRWLAYVLGTAHHEVDRRMQPINEYGTKAYFEQRYGIHGGNPALAKNLGNVNDGDGALFHGRGFVQLTGRKNYTYWQDRLHVDLSSGEAAAAHALDLAVATQIVFEGMIEGRFTGKKLADYFSPAKQDWLGARAIVNGSDKKALVASYAQNYYGAISYTTGP